MKQLISALLLGCCLLFMLTACDSGDTSAPSQAASSMSEAMPASSAAAQSSADSAAGSSTAPAMYDVSTLLETFSAAANLGATIEVRQLDLELSGVDVANFVAMAGAEAQTSAETGGVVLVIQATPGAGETVADELLAYRDARMGNEDYAEFETARTNTEQVRIEVFGDYVIYAVSATGHEGGWQQLDDAIAAAFA